ncbi:kinetoplastid kinetochore protein 14 [Trypanosoma equiperdum]|uniref:Kinetoplastid kinetochore protein 14 n=2 Tax=Trypanozoon TaxID=39700 RepID=Q38AN9_TRYB2|nr:hypothetical protein, conserved [Trypanosoma brucei brucei TREU927]EAN78131.1 hypothetical protein, conserved [Trypanosoma brucei brucei TREU927]SCU72591.1 kinetoplastid kinetochore protein 14 [Trypanosoma equiperdum]
MEEVNAYSPYKAYYGFDRTYIRRMSLLDYMKEDEDATSVEGLRCQTDDAKRRNGLLTSRDPNVVFRSQFPVRDNCGRELCVLYQIIESEVQHELLRVEGRGDATRNSAVRLASGTGVSNERNHASVTRPVGHVEEQDHEGRDSVYRPTPYVNLPPMNDTESNFEVSASTQRFSSLVAPSESYTLTPAAAAAGTVPMSQFSTYPDRRANPCVNPFPWSEGVVGQPRQQPRDQLLFQSEVISDGRHSAFPVLLSTGEDLGQSSENQTSQLASAAPPLRSSTASPLEWQGAVNDRLGGEGVTSSSSVLHAKTSPECPADGSASQRAGEGLSEFRTTKQLFPPKCGPTPQSTVHHPVTIPTKVYGAQSQTIPAASVLSFVNANVEAFCSGGEFYTSDASAPQVSPGKVLVLEGRFYRIVCHHASADVYEAQEMTEGPTQGVPSVIPSCSSAMGSPPQALIYRWSVRAVQEGVNEAHRAALGLSYVTGSTSAVHVAGYRYSDGGLTVITLAKGYRSVPLSLLPLSPCSFPTCMKLILKMLLDLVARRTVHGNLYGLNHIFFALPDGGGAQDMTSALLIPVHWEKLVDFSMFVDRNAGRTIPLTYGESCHRGECVFHGHDVATLMRALLENENAIHLHQQQVEKIRSLVSGVAEGMQVAAYLVQLNTAMLAIPGDAVALINEYNAALRFPR